MTPKRPRLLLADDHAILLDGLRGLLESEFELVGAVEDGRALLTAAEQFQPDAIVLDISMPLLNGIEAARHLRKSVPNAKLILLTMHSEAPFVKEAFRVGVSAYVLKRSASSELITAIREVLKGRTYVTPLITKNMLDLWLEGAMEPEKLFRDLTPRQREVLQLVAEGHSIKEIAAILNVSPKTVEFHKYRIMEGLGVRTTAELTRYAIKYGLVPA